MRLSSAVGTNNTLLQSIINNQQGLVVPTGQLVIEALNISVTQGPHATVDRATYTVPANKVARLSSVTLSLSVHTIPSSSSTVGSGIDYTPSGGAEVRLCGGFLYNFGNVNQMYVANLNYNLIMSAGDIVVWTTSDASTGGVIAYQCGAAIIEYDAP